MSDEKRPRATPDQTAPRNRAPEWVMVCILAVLLMGSVGEFYGVAAGTGSWYADISLKWLSALVVFTILCLAIMLTALVPRWRVAFMRRVVSLRNHLDGLPKIVAAILISLPILILQYSPWGIV